jgi:hypothetical protein
VTLHDDDLRRVVEDFGVSELQVRRDHLITHLLAALGSSPAADELIFYGGTALAKTHLTRGRLSEDIDLIALSPRRRDLAERLDAHLPRALLREFGRLRWDPALSAVSATAPAALVTPDGVRVRVQLLPRDHYPSWPVQRREVHSHYRDVVPGSLVVPTREAFVAWKTAAWADRLAPRDLWDLHALVTVGAFTDEAARLYRRMGPTGSLPGAWLFARPPSEQQWIAALAGQTRLETTAERAAATVWNRWRELAEAGV